MKTDIVAWRDARNQEAGRTDFFNKKLENILVSTGNTEMMFVFSDDTFLCLSAVAIQNMDLNGEMPSGAELKFKKFHYGVMAFKDEDLIKAQVFTKEELDGMKIRNTVSTKIASKGFNMANIEVVSPKTSDK